jgi:hypothetical protein
MALKEAIDKQTLEKLENDPQSVLLESISRRMESGILLRDGDTRNRSFDVQPYNPPSRPFTMAELHRLLGFKQ